MEKIVNRLAWLADNAVVIVFILMIIIAFFQVFFRYVLNNPLFGSEEIARLFAVWLTFLGASIAVKRGGHISVDILYLRVSSRNQKIFRFASDVFLLIFNLILLVEGTRLAYLSHAFESSALRFPMSIVFSALPISAFIILIFLIQSIRQDILQLMGRSG
ncbi:MAG: TRAP transporter small permease [Deltaproteobacteria bacterium]|nr:TRAP transporter small permease [Deltaproteobacteria bacterium]